MKKGGKTAPTPDRTDQFIERLKRYSDSQRFNIDDFPASLPRSFRLKIGPVAEAYHRELMNQSPLLDHMHG